MPSSFFLTSPSLLYANARGEIHDLPDLAMAGRSGRELRLPEALDMIPLPPGSELFLLPGRMPVGFDRKTGKEIVLREDPQSPGLRVQAVAAFMAPAHTACLTAAFHKDPPQAPLLPLFAYTAVGWAKDRFWVAAFRSDRDRRQEFNDSLLRKIEKKTRQRLQAERSNRLIQHLGNCCTSYGCPAARNLFLGRSEAPLPSSPSCNARCLGCISLQPSGCCPSTQERIRFVPSVKEIAAIAVPHLREVANGIVSFGQGCEGEPLLQAKLLEKSIRTIRAHTSSGTINCNSNSGLPDAVARLAAAGLDSLRVSLNSARDLCHQRYYRPQGFQFADLRVSIRKMKTAGRFVSLNYFILPGFTDTVEEFDALADLLEEERPDMIQLRNLNMDPDFYLENVHPEKISPAMGMRVWRARITARFPGLLLGYFNPALKKNL